MGILNYRKNNTILDTGYDLNNDKHCDIEGWFVNSYGHHKPVLHQHLNQEIINKIRGNLSYKNYLDSFEVFGRYSGYELRKFNYYTLNDDYLNLSSPELNRKLRENAVLSHEQKKYIGELDKLFNHYITKKDLIVYHGIGLKTNNKNALKLLSYEKDDIIIDKGFTSTSYDPKVCSKYVNYYNNNALIIMKIIIKSGTHCVPLFKKFVSSKKEEFEILLPRETPMVVKFATTEIYHGKIVKSYHLVVERE